MSPVFLKKVKSYSNGVAKWNLQMLILKMK